LNLADPLKQVVEILVGVPAHTPPAQKNTLFEDEESLFSGVTTPRRFWQLMGTEGIKFGFAQAMADAPDVKYTDFEGFWVDVLLSTVLRTARPYVVVGDVRTQAELARFEYWAKKGRISLRTFLVRREMESGPYLQELGDAYNHDSEVQARALAERLRFEPSCAKVHNTRHTTVATLQRVADGYARVLVENYEPHKSH
jgi:hypothetical protein